MVVVGMNAGSHKWLAAGGQKAFQGRASFEVAGCLQSFGGLHIVLHLKEQIENIRGGSQSTKGSGREPGEAGRRRIRSTPEKAHRSYISEGTKGIQARCRCALSQ